MKHFNMTKWRVLCPRNHLLKTATTTGDICELSSPQDVQSASWQSASWHLHELSSYPWAHARYHLVEVLYSRLVHVWKNPTCLQAHTHVRCLEKLTKHTGGKSVVMMQQEIVLSS